MNISLTHQEFVDLLQKQGLKARITKSRVLLTLEKVPYPPKPQLRYPGWFSDEVIESASRLVVTDELLSCVKENRKINGIKIIREQTRIGLREAKEFYEENEFLWRTNVKS